MDIKGPLRIGVLETPGESGWELHFDFDDAFQALNLDQQGEAFRSYIVELGVDIDALAEDDQNRQGMLLVQQLVEQLFPHVVAGELALNETIKVHIAQSPAAVSLSDLINSSEL